MGLQRRLHHDEGGYAYIYMYILCIYIYNILTIINSPEAGSNMYSTRVVEARSWIHSDLKLRTGMVSDTGVPPMTWQAA
jgi:hypothetical protein